MADGVEIEQPVKKPGCFFLLGPPFLLLSFGIYVTGSICMDLIIYRTCIFYVKHNATECSELQANSSSPEAMEAEGEIGRYATMIVMVQSLMEYLVPAMLSLFLGPWSDRRGRRPVLLASLTGCTLSLFALSLICDFDISPWYLLLARVPRNIVGGIHTSLLACTCYISDTTAEKYRTRQLAFLEASMSGGELLGALIGPLILENFGYTNVFRTGAVSSGVALVYIYYLIPESVRNTSQMSMRGLSITSSIKEILIRSSVKRDGFSRYVLWLAIPAFAMNAINFEGGTTILFLFARVRLGWDVGRYSYYDAASTALRITGLCGVSLIGPIFGISDMLLAAIALTSALGRAIACSFTWKSWHMYLSACIGIFEGVVGPVLQSIISKSVAAQDVGKSLSLSTFIQASSPLVGVPLCTLIFSHYLPPIYPSPVFLLTSSLYIMSILLIASICILLRRSQKLLTYVAASQNDQT